MPLHVQIDREGETVKCIWDWPMLSVALTACLTEACPDILEDMTEGRYRRADPVVLINDKVYEQYVDLSMTPIYYVTWPVPVLQKGMQILKRDHKFYIASREDENKRDVTLKKGDIVRAHRSMR